MRWVFLFPYLFFFGKLDYQNEPFFCLTASRVPCSTTTASVIIDVLTDWLFCEVAFFRCSRLYFCYRLYMFRCCLWNCKGRRGRLRDGRLAAWFDYPEYVDVPEAYFNPRAMPHLGEGWLIPLCRYRANCHGWYHCYLWPGRVCFNCQRLATKTTVVYWIHPARCWSVCRSCWDGCRVSVSPFVIVPGRMALINLLVLQLASSVMLVSVERHSNPDYT